MIEFLMAPMFASTHYSLIYLLVGAVWVKPIAPKLNASWKPRNKSYSYSKALRGEKIVTLAVDCAVLSIPCQCNKQKNQNT